MAFLLEILRSAAYPMQPRVPVINFLAPIYMDLAFTHYALAQLARTRKEVIA